MADCAKCKVNKKEGLIGCEGSCKRWFHGSCTVLTENESKTLDKCKNLFFLCDICKRKCEIVDKTVTSNCIKSIQDIDTNLMQLNTKVSETLAKTLQNSCRDMFEQIESMFTTFKNEIHNMVLSKIEDMNKNIQSVADNIQQKPSYANIVNNSKSSFILKPKNSGQSTSTTKADILYNLDPVQDNITLSNVQSARNGSLIISCDDEVSSKFSDLAQEKLGDKYEVKKLTALNPRVKIVGISDKFEENVLLNYIKQQNKSLFSENSQCQLVTFQPLRKNNRIYQAILQVDITTYNKLMECGKVFVGYSYCSIYDAIDLRRCFKCCGFHHIANHCSKTTPTCPKCSDGHTIKECTSNVLKCTLCAHYKNASKDNIEVDHVAWDREKCVVFKQTYKKFRTNILGIE